MSWSDTVRGSAAAAFVVSSPLACSSNLPPRTPRITVELPSSTAAPAPPSRESVEVVALGAEPRRAMRYALSAGTVLAVRTEFVVFQPLYRYRTTYGPVESNAGGFVVRAAVTFDSSNTLLSLFGPNLFPAGAGKECSGSIALDPRGSIQSQLDERCDRVDRLLYGFGETPLHPTIALPAQAVGVGARWSDRAVSEQPRGAYTLLDANDGVWTVWGELETKAKSRPRAGTDVPVPQAASLLARIAPSQLIRSATVAWSPAPQAVPGTAVVGTTTNATAPRSSLLVRLNSVAEGVADARDETHSALERALGSADVAVRDAAVRATGITNDWRFVERLLDLRGRNVALAASIDGALARLTARAARGPEDWIEASAPYFCRSDAQRAEAVLSRGIAAGGSLELEGKLLALRGDVRRALGNLDGADRDYRDAAARSPSDPEVVRSLAWWLATAPEAARRDGRRALVLLDTVSGNDGVLMLWTQTKAAALAEQGDFVAAERFQEPAVVNAKQAVHASTPGADERRAAAEERLEAYSGHTAWRQALVPDETLLCYRFRGLTNTLL